jgi:AbrB family looped-hinge helix DNA binding protein
MNAITKMSAKGQVVIPKDVRDRLHWLEGTQLKVVESGNAVTLSPAKSWLKPRNPLPKTTTGDILAGPKWSGRPFTVEEISSLSDEDLRQIFDEQERNAGD